MGRKNRRAKFEYRDRLGFNPKKYIGQAPGQEEPHPYRTPRRGDIWFAELGSHPGTSVQSGCRPVVIVSNDKGNHNAGTVVVLPMTTQIKRTYLPSHVEVTQENLSFANEARPMEPSMVLAEQITTIAKTALVNYLGRIEQGEKLSEIENAMRVQLAV